MFTVVAPASMARSTTSVEEIQFGAGGVLRRELDVVAVAAARWTPSTARRMISSLAILSLNSRWMALVARKTWMRGRAQSRRASPARSMSAALQRARPQMIGPSTSRAMACTASKSPGEAMGKPASMTSTPRSLRACATWSFSARFMLAPGRLLAVAQRRVEDDQAVVGHGRTPAKKKALGFPSQGCAQQARRKHRLEAPRTRLREGEACRAG